MSKQKLKESETVELKKSLAELKQWLISMAAILNKHKAGTLWFGIRNNGAVSGIDAVFKDRVEIRNPGKLFGDLTIDDLRKGNVSKRRNPLIADLFRRIEMVEAWGRGMPLILKYAPDAVFREIGGLFIVSFGRPSFFEQPEDETVAEKPADNLKTSLKASHKTFLNALTPKEKLVIDIIRENPAITREALAKKLDLSVGGARYNTDKLQAKGVLRRIGGKKAGRWEVLNGANK